MKTAMIRIKIGKKIIDLAELLIKKALVFARPPHMTKEEAKQDIETEFGRHNKR